MTIHKPITIRTAPETCTARTQRPSAERPGTERRPLGRALGGVECRSFSFVFIDFQRSSPLPSCRSRSHSGLHRNVRPCVALGTDIHSTGTNVRLVTRVKAGGFDSLPSRHQHARNTNTVGIDREPTDRPP